jgi:hypothetical protein
MSEPDALKLVNAAEGRLCIRFFRREDGTMLTRDCPVGLRAVRVKFARMWARAAAIFGAVTISSLFGGREARADRIPKIQLEMLREIKGDVCLTPAPAALNAATLLDLLRTARERDAAKTGGMPDALDPDAILESERQSLETRISSRDWKCPAPGTKEYELLVKQLTSVLKQHADLLQQFQIATLVAPVPVDALHPPVLGKMALPVRKIERIEDVRRALPE